MWRVWQTKNNEICPSTHPSPDHAISLWRRGRALKLLNRQSSKLLGKHSQVIAHTQGFSGHQQQAVFYLRGLFLLPSLQLRNTSSRKPHCWKNVAGARKAKHLLHKELLKEFCFSKLFCANVLYKCPSCHRNKTPSIQKFQDNFSLDICNSNPKKIEAHLLNSTVIWYLHISFPLVSKRLERVNKL